MKPFGTRLILLATVILCQACTSQFVVKTIYNNMDDSFADYLNDYAEFDKQQKAMIDQAATRLAQWHKGSQLPEYKRFVGETKLILKSEISEAEMERMAVQFESYGQAMAEQPGHYLGPLAETITAEQVVQIAENLEKEVIEDEKELRKELSKRDPENPNKERVKNIRQAFKRALGVKLNDEQLGPTHIAMDNSVDLRAEEIQLYREWNSHFIELLSQPHSELKTDSILQHSLAGTRLIRERFPAEAANNRAVSLQAFRLTLNSLNETQRQDLLERLEYYEDLLEELSKS